MQDWQSQTQPEPRRSRADMTVRNWTGGQKNNSLVKIRNTAGFQAVAELPVAINSLAWAEHLAEA